jgi:hypothetical protein
MNHQASEAIDHIFREKLGNHVSEIPEGFFEQMMSAREQMGDMPSDAVLRDKLLNAETSVSETLFDALMRTREGAIEMPEDNLLRARLNEHLSHVSPHIFYSLMAERERRRRRVVYGRWAVTALLLLVGTGIWMNQGNRQKDKIPAAPSLNQNTPSDRGFASPTETQGGEMPTQSSQLLQTRQTEPSIQNTKHLIRSNSTVLITEAAKKDKNRLAHLPNLDGQGALRFAKKQTQGSDLLPISEEKGGMVSENPVLNSGKNDSLSQNTAHGTPLIGEGGQKISAIENDLENATVHKEFEPTGLTLLNSRKAQALVFTKKDLVNPCTDPGMGCPVFDKKSRSRNGENAFYLDVYVAPEYAFRRLRANAPEMSQYQQARDTVERPWYAISTGIRASCVFRNGLAVRLGVAYNQNNEVATFDSLGIGKIVTTEIIRPNGIRDTVREITSGIFRSTRYNRYRSFDIPVQVGYELNLNDDWAVSANGGVNFNITAWQKADILAIDFRKQNLTNRIGEVNPIFRNQLGISLFGSLAVYRQLTGNLQAFAEPSVRYYLKPITIADYQLRQQYINAGLMLGLRYRF